MIAEGVIQDDLRSPTKLMLTFLQLLVVCMYQTRPYSNFLAYELHHHREVVPTTLRKDHTPDSEVKTVTLFLFYFTVSLRAILLEMASSSKRSTKHVSEEDIDKILEELEDSDYNEDSDDTYVNSDMSSIVENPPDRKLFKTQPVLQYFKEKFSSTYIPKPKIVVDDVMTAV
ncbi:hypothetical protein J437_LFUL000877 [Ladona fulva]|uniref:Uncharacterized protein n=1 Tax=Ladona fulva TaxID=123851 RepID=A0A8K0K7W0_LADFU|nr:hypothetical protein J437_LFUL000877 [Ladona fulva]